MDILQKLKFSDDTISLVKDRAIEKRKGEILFPFSNFKQRSVEAGELLTLNRYVEKSSDGLFLIEPEKDTIKYQIFYFETVLSMLCFYELNNKNLFNNALFVVVPIVPQFNSISILLDSFRFVDKHIFVFPSDIRSYCLEILLASYINGINNLSIRLEEDNFNICCNNQKIYIPVDKYKISQIIGAFKFEKNIVSKRLKNFSSYIDKFYYQ